MTKVSSIVLAQAEPQATMPEAPVAAEQETVEQHAAPQAVVEHTTHTEAPAKAGLPQLDPAHFPSQVFWLALVFITFYILISRVALPRIQRVLDTRETTLQDNLAQAKAAQEQAVQARTTYEKTQSEARAHAQQLIDAVQTRVKEVSAQAKAEMEAALANNIQAVESQLRASTARAMEGAATAATELTAAVIEKVALLSAPEADIKKTVEKLAKA